MELLFGGLFCNCDLTTWFILTNSFDSNRGRFSGAKNLKNYKMRLPIALTAQMQLVQFIRSIIKWRCIRRKFFGWACLFRCWHFLLCCFFFLL